MGIGMNKKDKINNYMKFIVESLEKVLRPKSEDEISQLIKGNGEILQISPEINKYFIIKQLKTPGIYYFIENGKYGFVQGNSPTKYIYTIDKGNIYKEHSDNYAKQELRSNSNAFNKGNPDKMSIPNNLDVAAKFILSHYIKLRKRIVNESLEDVLRPKSEKEI